MVILRSRYCVWAWKKLSSQALPFLMIVTIILESGCGTSDANRLKESRDAYLRGNLSQAESALFTPEVFKNDQNRLQHFYFLSSIAMSQGLFEKAIYFLNKSREIANHVRSSSGGFEWFSSDYRSNPVEYSYIHYLLVMAYSMLAEQGMTPEWHTPEIKDEKGNPLVPAQNYQARSYDAREIASFRQKARAELLAWDTHLENLKNTYPKEKYYKEDLWARTLASYLHGTSSDHIEKRTAELLTEQMKKIFAKEFVRYPSSEANQEKIERLISKLKDHAKIKKNFQSLLVCEAGVMSRFKVKRFHLGLSTLFSQIEDPGLRSMMEQIGIQVLLNEAPEFGLVLFTGAMAGAVDGGSTGEDEEFEGPPQFFTDAVDRSFGFEIRFPTLRLPPSDTQVKLSFIKPGGEAQVFDFPIVSPLQEILASELKAREESEMFKKALKIGMQYLAVLIPAVKAYRQADREGNGFKKLAILAGYFIAKKAIDSANSPDLRSWSFLPKLIVADLVPLPPGTYDAKLMIENHFGKEEHALGPVDLGQESRPIVYKRVGDIPILNR